MAVVIYDSVDGSAKLCSRVKLIKVLANQSLVRHGYVGSSHLESTDCFYGVLYLVSVDLEREVSIVSAYFRECFILHSRRAGVTDRISHETDKFGMSCDSFCHFYFSFI
jgi:hypothetical protein